MPSAVIRRFTYDPVSRRLDVELVSGRRYRYAQVPDELATRFRAAFSKGRFFNAHIRDAFACEELDEAEPRAPACGPLDHAGAAPKSGPDH
jgi:hypothetical protein